MCNMPRTTFGYDGGGPPRARLEEGSTASSRSGARAVRRLRYRPCGGIGTGVVRGARKAWFLCAAGDLLPGGGPLLRAVRGRTLPRPFARRRRSGKGHLVGARLGGHAPQRAMELRLLRPAQHAGGVLGYRDVRGAPDAARGCAAKVRKVLCGAAGTVLPVGFVRSGLDLRVVEAQLSGGFLSAVGFPLGLQRAIFAERRQSEVRRRPLPRRWVNNVGRCPRLRYAVHGHGRTRRLPDASCLVRTRRSRERGADGRRDGSPAARSRRG